MAMPGLGKIALVIAAGTLLKGMGETSGKPPAINCGRPAQTAVVDRRDGSCSELEPVAFKRSPLR